MPNLTLIFGGDTKITNNIGTFTYSSYDGTSFDVDHLISLGGAGIVLVPNRNITLVRLN